MASLGCVGVNLHGGANGYYSPIVGSIESGFAARPEYYGLMLAQQFAGRTLQKDNACSAGSECYGLCRRGASDDLNSHF